MWFETLKIFSVQLIITDVSKQSVLIICSLIKDNLSIIVICLPLTLLTTWSCIFKKRPNKTVITKIERHSFIMKRSMFKVASDRSISECEAGKALYFRRQPLVINLFSAISQVLERRLVVCCMLSRNLMLWFRKFLLSQFVSGGRRNYCNFSFNQSVTRNCFLCLLRKLSFETSFYFYWEDFNAWQEVITSQLRNISSRKYLAFLLSVYASDATYRPQLCQQASLCCIPLHTATASPCGRLLYFQRNVCIFMNCMLWFSF